MRNITYIFWVVVLITPTPFVSLANDLSRFSVEELLEMAEKKVETERPDSAIFIYNTIADRHEQDENFEALAGIYNTIGNIYLNLRNNPLAIEYFIKSAETYRLKTSNRKAMSRPLINIAVIQVGIGNTELALEYAQRGLKIAQEFEEELVIVFTQRLIGRINRVMGNYEQSIREIQQTISWYRSQQDWFNLAESTQGIANNYYDLRDYQMALLYSDSTLYFSRKSGNKKNLAYSHHSIAFSRLALSQYDMAILHSDSSILLARQISDPFLEMDGYRLNSQIMRSKLDIDGYDRYITLYISLRDSLDIVQQRAKSDELEAQFQNRVKQAEIDVLTLEQRLLESNVRRQKNMRNGITLTLLIVIVFSLILINRFRVLNETRRQLDVERLRNNIARDLHDDLGSTLSSISIISQMAVKNGNKDFLPIFSKIGTQSAIMMDKLSDIVWSINPDNDNIEQLIAKMREFLSEILEAQGILWKFHINPRICSLKPSLEKRKTIFLVFKEAVNNAAKYSQTERIDIFLDLNQDQLEVKVSDKGKGFDEEVVKRGNGLRNMRERARMVGGLVEISSQPMSGTQILLQIPIT